MPNWRRTESEGNIVSKGDTRKAMINVSGKGWASEEKYPLQLCMNQTSGKINSRKNILKFIQVTTNVK